MILKRKNIVEDTYFPISKLTERYSDHEGGYLSRVIDQWDGIGGLGINIYTYEQLIFDKGAKTTQKRKDSLFNNW